MLTRSALVLAMATLAACGNPAPPPPATPAAAPPAQPAAAPTTFTRKPAPAGAEAYIIEPADGATVTNPVHVVFGLKGIGVAPAGTDRADVGHHHLLIDVSLPENLAAPIPNDDQHKHFGGGQTETTLTLSPGKHTLQLLLGDNLHVPFDPPIASKVITIEVQ
ncbi:MAG TPA: DUF4399 domain-containing protein [Gammaproteobacteria bacterium]|nr:DUF4399 domain-containing protein [Gammaproteobacteria bacterium]